jgi:secreted trypsin-like serine protease
MRLLLAPVVIGILVWPSNADAIITRHDVSDEKYIAKAAELPSYCRMGAPDGGGALIAPAWVITAAHLAADLSVGHHFTCGEEELVAAEIVVHPDYDENVGRHDLALIRLAKQSQQRALKLWRDVSEEGRTVNLIGHWQGGTGLTGGDNSVAKKLRAATNLVSKADDHWLRLVMDAPGSEFVTALEGVSGAGDSGAPSFIVENGEYFLLGVGSRGSDTSDDGIEQNYGDTDLYVRVSRYTSWIDAVVGGQRPQSANFFAVWVGFAVLSVIAAAIVVWGLTRRRKAKP